MHHHLDYEDADLVPLFAEHFDQDEYDQLGKAASRSLGLGTQALFTVPFVASSVTDEQRQHLFADAPLPFRLMERMTRRRHARLAASALGDARRASPDLARRLRGIDPPERRTTSCNRGRLCPVPPGSPAIPRPFGVSSSQRP